MAQKAAFSETSISLRRLCTLSKMGLFFGVNRPPRYMMDEEFLLVSIFEIDEVKVVSSWIEGPGGERCLRLLRINKELVREADAG